MFTCHDNRKVTQRDQKRTYNVSAAQIIGGIGSTTSDNAVHIQCDEDVIRDVDDAKCDDRFEQILNLNSGSSSSNSNGNVAIPISEVHALPTAPSNQGQDDVTDPKYLLYFSQMLNHSSSHGNNGNMAAPSSSSNSNSNGDSNSSASSGLLCFHILLFVLSVILPCTL